MRCPTLWKLTIALSLMGASTGFAQLQAEFLMSQLANIANNPQIKQRIQQIFISDEKRFTPECTQIITKANAQTLNVFDIPRIAENGIPQNGHWSISYMIDVCGTNKMRTIEFKVADSQLEIAGLLPGNTLADAILQSDVQKSFRMALAQRYPSCQTPYIADTKLLDMPENGMDQWQELWVANACGTIFGQTIKFLPNKDGTAFFLDVE